MHLTHLSLTNFRSFTRLDMDIPRRVVLLTGRNAQGKTSLLEAIYFLAAFTSFQTHTDRQLINFIEAKKGLAVSRLVAEYARGPVKHRMEIRLVLEGVGINGQRLRKEVLLDGVKRPLPEVIGHFSAVIFVPQMSQIFEGGPDERRRYINLSLAQAVTGYARLISEYSQGLTQRNALLKNMAERGGDKSQLDFWDDLIARVGAIIIMRRIEALQDMEKWAARFHRSLTNEAEVLRFQYQPSYDPIPPTNGQISMPLNTTVQRNGFSEEDIRTGYLKALQESRNEDIRRGVTTKGPHRDELRFYANGVDLSDYGSRGQVRTALLALKLAETEWIKTRTGQWPVLLLDEVMAELDGQHRRDLLAFLEKTEQTVLTTTDLSLFSPEFTNLADIREVSEGTIIETQAGKEG